MQPPQPQPPQPPSTPVPQPTGRGRDGGGELLLGVDLGTSRCKAAVVSLDGVELAHGVVPIPWRVVPTGAEIDPQALVDAALDAAELALAGVPGGRVLALGVTSMAETCALLGSDGEPVAPAIAWHDQRGLHEAERMAEAFGADRFSVQSGLPPSPLCTLAKYRWLRDHSPAALGATRLLSVAEWVVHRLGGEQLAELSLASRTGMLDRDAGDWSTEVLAWADAPAGLVPPLVPAGTPYGKAARPGRLDGAVLTVAGHDHLCASVGAGVVAAGELFDSCGTAEALVQAVPPTLTADQVRAGLAGHVTAGWHVLPGLQVLLGAQRAGLALQRVLDLIGIGPEDRERLEREGVAAPAGAEGLALEHADGERALISGIGRHPSPGLLWRAAAEAVTRRSAELIATIGSIGGPARRIAVAGGWSRSPTLRAAKAERLGRLEYPAVVEAGARGAALLAGCAAGVYAGAAAVPRPRTTAAGAASPPPASPSASASASASASPVASAGTGAHAISHTEREPG
jgi:sugar (pentulose or hexulose) kinase